MREEWRIIESAPKYLISNLGRVMHRDTERIIKQQLSRGYPQVGLDCPDGWLRKSVHRLVASAFVPGEAPGLIVNHIDGDKTNCLPENLEWVTRQGNMDHAARIGLIRKNRQWTQEEWDEMHP